MSVGPPRRCLRSSTTTLRPASFTPTAAKVPPEPPPITHTSRSMVLVLAEAVREESPAAAKPAAEYDRSFSTFLRRRRIMVWTPLLSASLEDQSPRRLLQPSNPLGRS